MLSDALSALHKAIEASFSNQGMSTMCSASYECSLPLLNLLRLSLTRAVNPDPDGKNVLPNLFTSEKKLAEELGQKLEEMCTLERDINVLLLQVNAKRRRLSSVQDQCIAAVGSLSKVQKAILGEKAPLSVGMCPGDSVWVSEDALDASASSQTTPDLPK